MPVYQTILSRYAHRLLGWPSGSTKWRQANGRRRQKAPVSFTAEVIEERTFLSATFGGVITIGSDIGRCATVDVAVDAAGNSYVSGAFSGTVDFDLAHDTGGDILTARGTHDAYVAKYAADHSLVWVQQMGGGAAPDPASSMGESALGIAIDTSGNVYVTGVFQELAYFGATTLTSAGGKDGFVAKLNAGGTILWAKSWGTAADEFGRGIGVDSSGNVYALGTRGSYDTFDFRKFSATGTSVWSQTIVTGSNTAISGDLAVDAPGNVFVAGSFNGTVDFDTSARTHLVNDGPGGYGAFVLKLNKDGKFGWVTPFVSQSVNGVAGYSSATSVTLDSSGNVIVAGYYAGTVDFNPGNSVFNLPTSGRAFITKLSSSGGLTWAKALEANSTTFVNGLAVDSSNNIYATGSYYGTVDLDPGAGVYSVTAAAASDIFVLKLNSAGTFVWASTFSGSTNPVNQRGYGIAVGGPSNKVYVVGMFTETLDFDPADPLHLHYLDAGVYADGFLLELLQ